MQLKPPSLRTAAIAQEGTSMQRIRRMLTASRLCLLGIAVSASSFSVFAQCPNDTNCDARVRSISATASASPAVFGSSNSNHGVFGGSAAGFPWTGVFGYGASTGVQGQSDRGNGV
jgi:hypothetical protein